MNMAEMDKAESLHEQALSIREKTLGPKHPDIAISLNNLAQIFELRGEYNKAIQFIERGRIIVEEACGTNNLLAGILLDNLGRVYLSQNRLGEAEATYRSAMNILNSSEDARPVDRVVNFERLAKVLKIQGMYIEAEEILKRALSIWQEVTSSTFDARVAYTLRELAKVYEASEKWEEAVRCHLEALDILAITFGRRHPEVIESYEALAFIAERQGYVQEATDDRAEVRVLREEWTGKGRVALSPKDLLDTVYPGKYIGKI